MLQQELYDKYLKLLSDSLNCLEDKPEETAESTLSTLWHMAAGNPCSVQLAITSELPELDDEQVSKLDQLFQTRISGIPLAHITERQNFMGIELIAGKEALVPRKETELLGNAALNKLRDIVSDVKHPVVVDVCTGSGNLALALASKIPEAKVYAADLSNDAILLAKRNNEFLTLQEPVEFRCGDLLEPFNSDDFYEKVDLLTCNPPYISSGKLETMPGEIIEHEPDLAFDGGPFGVKIIQRLLKDALKYLKPGGWLAFEIGLGQGEPLIKRLEKNKAYSESFSIHDENGDIRAILAKKI